MNPKIIYYLERKVVGLSSTINRNEPHKIGELWRQFMPEKYKIKNVATNELIAMQLFPNNINNEGADEYTIWATVEVHDFENIPNGMLSYIIPSGDYAIFTLKGMNIQGLYEKIMTEWLPKSGYTIDDRPHFQIMGENYKNGSPDSEEDIYIPIKTN